MKRICVVTGSRAEYGLLRPLIRRIQESAESELSLVVTGSHLDESFGLTKNEIISDGFPINAEIRIPTDIIEKKDMGNATGKAIEAFSEYFFANRPDILVILGDRYEIFGVTFAAAIQGIPVAHIHGGEVTEGAVDDFLRHSITKMSWLHFTSCEEYRRRVIQLGEDPKRVFNVGALGVENCLSLDLLSEKEIRENLALGDDDYAVVTFHPATLDMTSAEKQIRELICAMDAYPDLRYVITLSNADAGGDEINRIWKLEGEKRKNWKVVASLGVVRYLSALKYAKLILGNSSSGIIEGPAIRIPTVNVGDRQRGRIMADSVISCPAEKGEIESAIRLAFSDEMQCEVKNIINPYGDGNTSGKILDIILEVLGKGICDIKKSFYDVQGKSFSKTVQTQVSSNLRDLKNVLMKDDPVAALSVVRRHGKQLEYAKSCFTDIVSDFREMIYGKQDCNVYRDSLIELFYTNSVDDFNYALFLELNRLHIPLSQADSLMQQHVRRRRMKQIGNVPDRWLVFSKEYGERFAKLAGLTLPEGEDDLRLDQLYLREKTVIKPNKSSNSVGAYIVYNENDIWSVEEKKPVNWNEMIAALKEKIDTDLITDNFKIQELVYTDIEKGLPAHDLKFFAFYGEIPIVFEIERTPPQSQWAWSPDGRLIDLGFENQPGSRPYGVTKEMMRIAKELSLKIPAPYMRLDFLRGENAMYFDEFCSMGGKGVAVIEQNSPKWNKLLGKYYLQAEMRLMNDLLSGKRFDEIMEFNRQIEEEQAALRREEARK